MLAPVVIDDKLFTATATIFGHPAGVRVLQGWITDEFSRQKHGRTK